MIAVSLGLSQIAIYFEKQSDKDVPAVAAEQMCTTGDSIGKNSLYVFLDWE